MSRPKRHHFVPQFHLRRFSADGRSIRCFNKKRRRLIERAPIKGQCSIENFYDWHPDVEKALGEIEGVVSPLISEICRKSSLSLLTEGEWQALLLFIAIQSGRTKAIGDTNDKITDHFVKIQAAGAPELRGIDLSRFDVKNTYPSALPLEVSIKAAGYLSSLGACILENNTRFPFFCSDNPVLRYNAQGSWVKHQGVIGFDCAGLQVFYFLGPNHILYLYDKNAYGKPSNTEKRILSLDDVIALNIMHYLWSDENIYIVESQGAEIFEKMAHLMAPYEAFERLVIVETESTQHPDGTSGSIVVHWRSHVPVEYEYRFAPCRIPYDEDKVARSKPRRVRMRERDPRSLVSYRISNPPTREHLKDEELRLALREMRRIIDK